MSPELQEQLYIDFPILFADKDDPESPMHFGICCGDGWEPIIRRLCERLTDLGIIQDNIVIAQQVKEKFGKLCFYITGGTTEQNREEQEAVSSSSIICENCGAPGYLRTHRPWKVTLCDSCDEQEDIEYPIRVKEQLRMLQKMLKKKAN